MSAEFVEKLLADAKYSVKPNLNDSNNDKKRDRVVKIRQSTSLLITNQNYHLCK